MTDALIDDALARWAERTGLDEPALAAVRRLQFTRRTIARDGYVVREGETPVVCTLLLRGCAFRQKVIRDGARQILSFHFPGDFIDLQGCLLSVNDHSVQALGGCEVATVPRADLAALIHQHPSAALAMWFDSLLEASVFREWVVNVGRRNARARIAHLICELAVRLGGAEAATVYRLPLTQEHIADATGMTAVHTNRTIQSLRREGVISLSGGRLEVHQWDTLRGIGDFSSLYLHRESRPRRS